MVKALDSAGHYINAALFQYFSAYSIPYQEKETEQLIESWTERDRRLIEDVTATVRGEVNKSIENIKEHLTDTRKERMALWYALQKAQVILAEGGTINTETDFGKLLNEGLNVADSVLSRHPA